MADKPRTIGDLLKSPPKPAGPNPDTRPFGMTNPYLAKLRDFTAGLLGIYDPFTPEASNATVAGAGLGAIVPVAGALRGSRRVIPAVRQSLAAPMTASEAIDTIRRHGFDVESFDDRIGAWVLSDAQVSDTSRGMGQTSRRAVPPAARKALESLNTHPIEHVAGAINQSTRPR